MKRQNQLMFLFSLSSKNKKFETLFELKFLKNDNTFIEIQILIQDIYCFNQKIS